MGSIAYDRANTRQIKFKLNLKTDADILERLDAVPNIQGYLKRLIRQDMARSVVQAQMAVCTADPQEDPRADPSDG